MIRHILVALGLILVPLSALAVTPADIRACTADRRGEGCATLLNRLFVCERAAAIAGCDVLLALREQALSEPEAVVDEEAAMADDDCPVLDSADWRAVVGPVSGAEGPHLIVTGRVTLPTPGWQVALAEGIADRSAMPVQRVMLTATPPDGMVAQVLTDYDLRLETPALAGAAGMPPYRGVMVMCGGTVLVDLAEVGLTE